MDILTVSLPSDVTVPDSKVQLLPLEPSHRDELAEAYFKAYPPEIGAATLAEAQQEMDETFAGEYGILRPDASAVAVLDGRVVGSIMVVERSVWDDDLEGPFIIDFFLHPDAQSTGAGKALAAHAVAACSAAGDESLSLRHGEGTSPAAYAIYTSLGFEEDEY